MHFYVFQISNFHLCSHRNLDPEVVCSRTRNNPKKKHQNPNPEEHHHFFLSGSFSYPFSPFFPSVIPGIPFFSPRQPIVLFLKKSSVSTVLVLFFLKFFFIIKRMVVCLIFRMRFFLFIPRSLFLVLGIRSTCVQYVYRLLFFFSRSILRCSATNS